MRRTSTWMAPLMALVAAAALSGAERPSCVPVATEGVTMRAERESYEGGDHVTFRVDPNGTAIYVQSGGMDAPLTIQRRDPETGTWRSVRAWMPFGCYVTDCYDGQAISLCADPGPLWCDEHLEPFDVGWTATEWIRQDVPCGGEIVEMVRSVPARPGEYRAVLGYGLGGISEEVYLSECLGPHESVEDTFTIAAPVAP